MDYIDPLAPKGYIDPLAPKGSPGIGETPSYVDPLDATTKKVEPEGNNPLTNFFGGIYTGTTRGLPGQVGKAMQFAGIGEDTGKALADYAKEGEVEGQEKGAFRQAGEMVPLSVGVPLGLAALGKLIGVIPHPIAKATGVGISLLGKYVTPAMFGLSQAQETKEEAEKRGVEPGAAPYLTGGVEWAGETVANSLMGRILGPLAPAGKIAQQTVKKALVPTIGKFVKEMALVQMPTEVATEMAQNYAEASIEKGYGIRPEADPWAEAKSAISPTLIMTAAMGGAGRVLQKVHANTMTKILADPNADPAYRSQVADGMANLMATQYNDPEMADLWKTFAKNKIDNKLAIDVDNMTLDKENLQIQNLIDASAKELGMTKEISPVVNKPAAEAPQGPEPMETPVPQAPVAPEPPAGPVVPVIPDVSGVNPTAAATDLGRTAIENFASQNRLQTLAKAGALTPTGTGTKGTTPLESGSSISEGTAEAKRTPPPSFATLTPMPLSPTDTVSKAKERLSQPDTAYTASEMQQRKDLESYEKDSKPSKAMSIKDEAGYLYRKAAKMITDSQMSEQEKASATEELGAMLDWYAKSYPAKIGLTMLRNELRDITHGGAFDLSAHAKDHEAAMENYKVEEGAKIREKLPPAFRPLTQIPSQAQVRFSDSAQQQIDKWLGVKQMGGKTITAPDVDSLAKGLQLSSQDLTSHLIDRGIPIQSHEDTYSKEFEAKHPAPKPTEVGRMGQLRPLYSWLATNFKGKISRESLERAFGGMETATGLNLKWLSGGKEDFLQVVTEKGADNPFNGLIDPEDIDAASHAKELLLGEMERAKGNDQYTADKGEWEALRDQYIRDRMAEAGATTREDTPEGFTEEPKTFEEIAADKGTIGALDSLLGNFDSMAEAQRVTGAMDENATYFTPDGMPYSMDTMVQALEKAKEEGYFQLRGEDKQRVLQKALKVSEICFLEMREYILKGMDVATLEGIVDSMTPGLQTAMDRKQGDMFPGTKKSAVPRGTPAAAKSTEINKGQQDIFTTQSREVFFREQAHLAYVAQKEKEELNRKYKEKKLMETINQMRDINDRMKEIEKKYIYGKDVSKEDAKFWDTNVVFWYQNQGVSSVDQLESIRRDKLKEAEGDADSFWLGKVIANKKHRVWRPDPNKLIEVAKMYESAEAFEAEWNTTKIGFGVMDAFYGEGNLPIPMVKEARILRETLQKYDITIDDIVKKGEEAFTKAPTQARKFKENYRFQTHLYNYIKYLQAYWSIPEIEDNTFDYKGFWTDIVKHGQSWEPSKGYRQGNLNHYFAASEWLLPGDLFKPGEVKEKLRKSNIMTTEEFISRFRAEEWKKDVKDMIDWATMVQQGEAEERALKKEMKMSYVEGLVSGAQGKLFSLDDATPTELNTAPNGKTYVTFKYITNPRAFGVNMNPSITVLHPTLKSDIPYDPKFHEIVNREEYDNATKYLSEHPEAETVMSETQQMLSGLKSQPTSLNSFGEEITEFNDYNTESDLTHGSPMSFSSTIPTKLRHILQTWQAMMGMKGSPLFVMSYYDLDEPGFDKKHGFSRKDWADVKRNARLNRGFASYTHGFFSGDSMIYIGPEVMDMLAKDNPMGLEIIGHEFGHYIAKQLFIHEDSVVQAKIIAEWMEWKDRADKQHPIDYYHQHMTPFKADYWTKSFTKEGLGKWDQASRSVPQNRKSFNEYFADQVAIWLTTKAKPRSVVEHFFAKVAGKIREFFSKLQNRLAPEVQKNLETWLDEHIILSARDLATQPVPTPAETDAPTAKSLFYAGPLFNQPGPKQPTIPTDMTPGDRLLPPKGSQGRLFDEVKWQQDHAGESIELGDPRMKQPIQFLEDLMADNDILGSALDRANPLRIVKDMYHKYLFQPTGDLHKFEALFSLPNFLARKFPLIGWARDIQLKRDENRNILIHDYLRMANNFMRLEGEPLAKVEKALIAGDRELPQRLIDLEEEAAKLKKEARLHPGNSVEYAEIMAKANEKAQEAAELRIEGAYSDGELGRKFNLGPQEIMAYRQVRTTLDSIHQRWLDQAMEKLMQKHQGKRWYSLLKALYDRDLSRDEMGTAMKNLGMLYKTWHDTLKAAATPLKTLLRTPEDLEKVSIKSADIITKAMNDIASGSKMTAERATKIIEKALARIQRMEGLTSADLTPEKIDRLVKSYTKKYQEVQKAVSEMRSMLRGVLSPNNPALTDEDINKDLRELMIAYGRTKPQMQRLTEIRNDLGNWVGFFPRERDDNKRHFLLVYRDIKDKDGNIVGKEHLYYNFYNVEAVGGKKMKETATQLIKERFSDEEMKDIHIETGVNVKQPDSTFFKVSDMNTQRVIDNAINSLFKGSLRESEGDDLRNLLLQAVADEMNQRGFGRHRMKRLKEFDSEGKLKTVLGYKETGLREVLLNYITGYAGMETKQQAAIEFTDLLAQVGKDTPILRDYIHKYSQEQLRNQEKIDRINGSARAILFAYYLGSSLKAPLVQLTQNYVTAIPFLAQTIRKVNKNLGKKAGMLEAERRYHAAMKDIGLKKLSADDKAFIEDLMDRGTMMDQYTQEVTGQVRKSFGGYLNRVIKIMAYPFSQAEIFNRKSAGLAMYRFLKSTKAYSEEACRKEAREYIYGTHYLMGKANLPGPMMGADFTPQSMRALYTFRSFTHNYILSMMPRYGGDMRTAMHSLAYLALLGGLMSLPFLKDLFDWWEKEFGEDLLGGVKKELRKYGGPTLEKFGVYGLAGLMVGDISGSLSIGVPFVGEPTDTIYGVWGGVANKIKKTGAALKRGDTYRAVENISPIALENVMKAFRMSDFGKDTLGLEGIATTEKGRPIFDENGKAIHLTAEEAFTKMIGFQPVGYSKSMEENRTVNNIEEYFNEKHISLAERYRVAAMRKDQSAMARVFSDIKEYNKERLDKHAELIVPFLRLGNVIKSAAMIPRKAEMKEAMWKRNQLSD